MLDSLIPLTIFFNEAGAAVICFPDAESTPEIVAGDPVTLASIDGGCVLRQGDAVLGLAATGTLAGLLAARELFFAYPAADGLKFLPEKSGRVQFELREVSHG